MQVECRPRAHLDFPLETGDLWEASDLFGALPAALFERAKFSAHDIGPSLKEDAIEALVSVRDELRSYR